MIIRIKQRKPIIQIEDSVTFDYKYCHVGYVLNVPILCYSDLNERQFEMLCDGKFNRKQIEKFEMTGKF